LKAHFPAREAAERLLDGDPTVARELIALLFGIVREWAIGLQAEAVLLHAEPTPERVEEIARHLPEMAGRMEDVLEHQGLAIKPSERRESER
jgi:hypothetical protein